MPKFSTYARIEDPNLRWAWIGLGLIEVRVGAHDARERLAYLTPKGRRVVQSLTHFVE